VICGLTGSAVLFLHYVTKDMIFGVKLLENEEGVLIFSTNFSDTFLILTRLERNIMTM